MIFWKLKVNPRSMANPIQEAIKAGEGKGILYAGLLGLALSDAIPTPADALYFYRRSEEHTSELQSH